MWRVLAVLANANGQRQIDVAARTSIDVSTLSRVVTRLVKMGLVTRTRSATNNREVVVRLTPKGAVILARVIPHAIALERTAIAGGAGKGSGRGQAQPAADVPEFGCIGRHRRADRGARLAREPGRVRTPPALRRAKVGTERIVPAELRRRCAIPTTSWHGRILTGVNSG